MPGLLHRSFDEPDRNCLSYDDTWHASDKSLIKCWEVGRQLRLNAPELAARAGDGELVTLPWKGGTGNLDKLATDIEPPVKYGTLRYLAMWQGLRGDDLHIDIDSQVTIVCTRTDRAVIFDLTSAADLEQPS
jgi:hypothetical protein